jgi:sarcosine oxidase
VRIGIVGAGIVGLATAAALAAAGHEVRCYDSGEPMAARSLGETRIFRTAHAEPGMVELALRAQRSWQRWEKRFGTRLVDPVTTVLNGAEATVRATAMQAAGAPFSLRDDAAGLGLPASDPRGPFLVDAGGGVINVTAAGCGLRETLGSQVRAHDLVRGVDVLGADHVRIAADSGAWDCHAALLLAGAGTPSLAAAVGIGGVPPGRWHSHRFTFALRDASARPPCWLERSEYWRAGVTSYQHLVGPGRWAVGASVPDEDSAWELGRDGTRERAQGLVRAYVAEQVDGVVPDVLDTISCDSMNLGDGLGFGRSGPVLALWGDNLMKLAPLLGELLASAALDRDREVRDDDVPHLVATE